MQSWVLTTAYCAQLNDEFDHPNFEVIAGILDRNNDESGQIRHVEKAYVHPYFSSDQGSDVALLKLDFPLEFNENVTAVHMAVDAEALESTFMDCTESGWSKEDKHPIMQKSPLILIDTEVCQESASDGDRCQLPAFALEMKVEPLKCVLVTLVVQSLAWKKINQFWLDCKASLGNVMLQTLLVSTPVSVLCAIGLNTLLKKKNKNVLIIKLDLYFSFVF